MEVQKSSRLLTDHCHSSSWVWNLRLFLRSSHCMYCMIVDCCFASGVASQRKVPSREGTVIFLLCLSMPDSPPPTAAHIVFDCEICSLRLRLRLQISQSKTSGEPPKVVRCPVVISLVHTCLVLG